MGSRPYAKLFFGITTSEEGEWDGAIAVRLGWQPAGPSFEGDEDEEWPLPEDEDYDAYDDAKKHLEPLGLALEYHTSYDQLGPIICAEMIETDWDDVIDVPQLPPIDEAKIKALREISEKLGWGEPRWQLAAFHG